MTEFESTPAPPDVSVADVVDDPVFTDVTDGGEHYTQYTIVNFVYQFGNHPQGWTHLAVVRDRAQQLHEAFLRVIGRAIEESYVLPVGE